MLEKYGLQSSVASGNYNIAREPLYFVRSGAVNLERNSLRKSGDSGYFWSSVAFTYVSPTFARSYHVYFDSGLHPTGYGYRFIGVPVRCLVY